MDAAKAFVHTSNATRRVLLVVIITSIIAFIALWNSFSGGFLNLRYEIAEFAQRHKVFSLKTLSGETARTQAAMICALVDRGVIRQIEPDVILDSTSRVRLLALGLRIYLREKMEIPVEYWCWERYPKGIDYQTIQGRLISMDDDSLVAPVIDSVLKRVTKSPVLQNFEEAHILLEKAIDLCISKGFNNETNLFVYAWHISQMRLENIIGIDVPFLGVIFDVNDLGVFAGLSFFVIVAWLRNALRKEYTNLREVFSLARKWDSVESYYRYLNMRVLFSMPMRLDRLDYDYFEKDKCRPWYKRFFVEKAAPSTGRTLMVLRWIPLLLASLPAIILILIIWHDSQTMDYGQLSSGSVFLWSRFIMTIWFFVSSLWLTWRCISIINLSNRAWDRALVWVKWERKQRIELYGQTRLEQSQRHSKVVRLKRDFHITSFRNK